MLGQHGTQQGNGTPTDLTSAWSAQPHGKVLVIWLCEVHLRCHHTTITLSRLSTITSSSQHHHCNISIRRLILASCPSLPDSWLLTLSGGTTLSYEGAIQFQQVVASPSTRPWLMSRCHTPYDKSMSRLTRQSALLGTETASSSNSTQPYRSLVAHPFAFGYHSEILLVSRVTKLRKITKRALDESVSRVTD